LRPQKAGQANHVYEVSDQETSVSKDDVVECDPSTNDAIE
jgi:hypothetical protein